MYIERLQIRDIQFKNKQIAGCTGLLLATWEVEIVRSLIWSSRPTRAKSSLDPFLSQ
jgi:hypothetical protein